MIIAHISDPHITTAGQDVDRLFNTAAHLERAASHLNGLSVRPDCVIVTGDCINGGSGGYAHEYDRFGRLIAPLTMPVYVVPGNHDSREHLRAFISSRATQVMPDFIQYAVDDGPVRLIALDTHIPGRADGELCAVRLGWLEERLAEAPGRPTVLCMHHPPFATYLQPSDDIGLKGADALGAIVARYPNVERILAGHVHRAVQRRFWGSLAMTCPSTAHQFSLDLKRTSGFEAIMEPPACLLHVWHPAGSLVTHTSVIGAFGPAMMLA